MERYKPMPGLQENQVIAVRGDSGDLERYKPMPELQENQVIVVRGDSGDLDRRGRSEDAQKKGGYGNLTR